MAKEVDYVQFVRDFERQHGRPPTAEELEQGTDPLAGIVTWSTPEETQAEMDRINASYKPTIGERVTDGLSLLGRGLFKTVILLFQTPIYLTLFFFNLIKATIATFVVWFVSKAIVYIAIGGIMDLIHIRSASEVPGWLNWFGSLLFGKQMFTSELLEPNFFPYPVIDAWLIGITIVFLALVATFTRTEYKER